MGSRSREGIGSPEPALTLIASRGHHDFLTGGSGTRDLTPQDLGCTLPIMKAGTLPPGGGIDALTLAHGIAPAGSPGAPGARPFGSRGTRRPAAAAHQAPAEPGPLAPPDHVGRVLVSARTIAEYESRRPVLHSLADLRAARDASLEATRAAVADYHRQDVVDVRPGRLITRWRS